MDVARFHLPDIETFILFLENIFDELDNCYLIPFTPLHFDIFTRKLLRMCTFMQIFIFTKHNEK
jgi:hypothetical protein